MNNQRKTALHFILLMGIVSALGDITYEGGRSVYGPYLAVLGASAGTIGLISGFGELLGYGLRLVSGYLSDRTQKYWLVTIAGYAMLASVPLLAIAGNWYLAAVFIILERVGKAVRSPAKDAILSHATKQMGRGLGFGIHEALDQCGAIIGPLIFMVVLFADGNYRQGFSLLWIPVILTVAFAFIARAKVPVPETLENTNEKPKLEKPKDDAKTKEKLPRIFWLYAAFTFISVTGFANFQVISYHFKVQNIVPDAQIPILYAVAMGVDAIVALIVGKTYDKRGLVSLIAIPVLTAPIPFLAFSHSYVMAIISVILWGCVMAIHETIMRAAIADITPIRNRGFAYGIFNTIYGVSWFLGSTLIGFLYDSSIGSLIVFVVAIEVLALIMFNLFRKKALELHAGI